MEWKLQIITVLSVQSILARQLANSVVTQLLIIMVQSAPSIQESSDVGFAKLHRLTIMARTVR